MARLSVSLHVKRHKLGDGALSHREHVVADVMSVQAEVVNGGFHQFFFNQAGDRAAQTVSALREIGAAATAAIVARACSRLPGGAPDANRFARQRQLEALAPEAFRDLDKRFGKQRDRIASLLAAYWNEQRP
ncbi:MAG TPA: DUF4375 domain-containing protein [Polyangia bacterium]